MIAAKIEGQQVVTVQNLSGRANRRCDRDCRTIAEHVITHGIDELL
jgi:hypothetical protein